MATPGGKRWVGEEVLQGVHCSRQVDNRTLTAELAAELAGHIARGGQEL